MPGKDKLNFSDSYTRKKAVSTLSNLPAPAEDFLREQPNLTKDYIDTLRSEVPVVEQRAKEHENSAVLANKKKLDELSAKNPDLQKYRSRFVDESVGLEGIRESVYGDRDGKDVPEIELAQAKLDKGKNAYYIPGKGYLTIGAGTLWKPGMPTRVDAREALKKASDEINKADRTLRKQVGDYWDTLPEKTRVGFALAVNNIGTTHLNENVIPLLKQGKVEAAANRLLLFNKSRNDKNELEEVEGLKRRRAYEVKLIKEGLKEGK